MRPLNVIHYFSQNLTENSLNSILYVFVFNRTFLIYLKILFFHTLKKVDLPQKITKTSYLDVVGTLLESKFLEFYVTDLTYSDSAHFRWNAGVTFKICEPVAAGRWVWSYVHIKGQNDLPMLSVSSISNCFAYNTSGLQIFVWVCTYISDCMYITNTYQ